MQKVVGVGLHKTGTTTLGQALKLLDLRVTGWRNETASLYHRGHAEALIDMMQDFDVFEDAPWYLLYKQAAKRYPVKLILTRRSGYDIWFDSLIKHNDRTPADQFSFRKLLYGADDLTERRADVIAKHKQHIEEVREFASSNKISILEVCWENGDGWPELCEFLEISIPTAPFPHANAAPKTSRSFIHSFKKRLR